MKGEEYSVYIMTGSITRVNNDLELLKLINEINWKSSFVTYALHEGELKCKVQIFSHLEVVVEDVLSLINIINKNIEDNYAKFIKSNWV